MITASWPSAGPDRIDDEVEGLFTQIQQIVTALREVRTTHKVPPRQKVSCSFKASDETVKLLSEHRGLIGTLANAELEAMGPDVERPESSGATAVGEIEIYVHDLVDADAERERLERRLEEVRKRVGMLDGRLANKKYVDKAPPHLVQQTRDQLEETRKELAALEKQVGE